MYKTIIDKQKVFNEFTINTEEELLKLVTDLGGNPCLRFRGVSESKYTMLTSLQRKHPAPVRVQKEYVSRLLRVIKSDAEVIDFFNNRGIAINDVSCLALMQHQGLPTPLIDFSTDIKVALAFAADGLKVCGGDETDDYVSLYVFDKVFEYELGIALQQMYMTGMAMGYQRWQEHIAQHPDKPVNASVLYNIDEFIRWYDVKDLELMYVEYQPIAPGVVTLAGQSLNLSNPNLDRQKGCFILNLYDDKIPLEENWNGRTIAGRNHFWQYNVPGVRTLPFSGVMTRNKMTCFDIKKSVIKQWDVKNPMQLYDNSPANVAIKQKLADLQSVVDGKSNTESMIGQLISNG